jgi:hypothetical protein
MKDDATTGGAGRRGWRPLMGAAVVAVMRAPSGDQAGIAFRVGQTAPGALHHRQTHG